MREWIRARPGLQATASAPLTEADLREAYARGRRDERARRRRSPTAMLAVSLAALAGAGALAVSASRGASAGVGVDDRVAEAAIGAEPRLREAAAGARSLLTEVGARVAGRAEARALDSRFIESRAGEPRLEARDRGRSPIGG